MKQMIGTMAAVVLATAAALSPPVLAGGLELVTPKVIHTAASGSHVIQPCVRNNGTSAEPLRVRVGSLDYGLHFNLGQLQPGKTECFSLDASFLSVEGDYKVDLE